jgi:S1-C subfamily serine protease
MRGSTYLRGMAALFLTCGPVAAQQVVDFTAVVRRVQPAVVTLRTYDATGHPMAVASGFLVEGGRVVTNAHVVDGISRVEVYDAKEKLLGTAQHLEALSPAADLAVLPAVQGAPAGLPLADDDPEVGEAILAIGSPRGLTHTVSDGLVSAMREMNGRRWIQISAPISEGSSGGPVLNRRGEVVGVSVAILTEGQNLNFAIPARQVRAILTGPRSRLAFPGAVRADRFASHAAPRPAGSVRIGDTVVGTLDPSDTRLGNGAYVDMYQMSGRKGEVVTITVRSGEFDAIVVVGDPARDAEPLAADDDSAGGSDAQVTVTLPRDGTYAIGVAALGARPVGRYTLSVRPADGAAGPVGAVSRSHDR